MQTIPENSDACTFFGALANRVVDGKYRVGSFLASGGVGVVYAAEHVGLRERVALKFLGSRWAKDKGIAERFLREARTQFRICSENVARVLDVGTTDWGTPYFVMELVDGVSLRDLVDRVGRVSVGHAVEIVRQASLGLAAAHDLGVVHRDVKSGNMMLEDRNGKAAVKVLDFGLADVRSLIQDRVLEARLTPSSLVMGTPVYMAPEQLRGARHATPRSDVWSMGIVLYELLTGRKPYDFVDLAQCVQDGALPDRPPVHALVRGIPEPVSAIVERCLAQEPSDRYADGGELARALTPHALPFAMTDLEPLPAAPKSAPKGLTMARTKVPSADGHTAFEVHELVELRTGTFTDIGAGLDRTDLDVADAGLDVPDDGLTSDIPERVSSLPSFRSSKARASAFGAAVALVALVSFVARPNATVSVAITHVPLASRASHPSVPRAADAPPTIELDAPAASEAPPATSSVKAPPAKIVAVPTPRPRSRSRRSSQPATPVPLTSAVQVAAPFSPYVDRW